MTAAAQPLSGMMAAARARRDQLLPRCALACVVALTTSQIVGLQIAGLWAVAYVLAQLPELLVFDAVLKGRVDHLSIVRKLAGTAAIALNALVFASLSAPLWMLGGPAGGVCAVMLCAGGMINVVAVTPGSPVAAGAAFGPQVAALLSSAYFLTYFGAPPTYQAAAAITALGVAVYSVALWRSGEQARRSEAAAHAETERRRAEAEAATAAKSAYVAMIGHDLRTPISAMLAGAIELERAAGGTGLRSHASLIADAGRMMKTLLDDVLDHAKLEAGRMSVESTAFDLRRLVAHTARFWRAEARKKGLRLRIEGARFLPGPVRGDPTRMRQVLNNLISNAVKFTDEGSVSLRLNGWPAGDDDCAVLIQVADTGPGMDREQLGRLFTAFQQGDRTVARFFGGTGLGLVISRELARLMGGELTAYSVKGQGAVFTLALTFAEASAADMPAAALAAPAPHESGVSTVAAPPPSGPVDPHAIRVLVADDHEINRRAVQLVLGPLSAQVTAVADGRAAVEAAARERFDVIVMDVRMPEMCGREASRTIRNGGGPNAATPIIAVTADTDKDDIQACFEAGMELFVGKPIDPGKLLEMVAMATRPAISAGATTPAQVMEAGDGSGAAASSDDGDTRPLRVLVADDHEINRRAVQLVLEPAGALVTTVNDGKTAWEAAQVEAFDVIVMDVRMPEMDGREATRRIRATPGPNQTTPIIAVTAEVDSQACFDAGMNLFVGKPIDPVRLIEAVSQAIDLIESAESAQTGAAAA